MTITYELKEKDFYEGLIACRNRRPFTRWGLRLVIAVNVFFVAFGLFAAIVRPETNSLSDLLVPSGLLIFFVLLFWVSPWLSARKQFRGQPGAQGARTVTLDSTGVHWSWDGGNGDVAWKNYVSYLETKNVFLLFSSPIMFGVIPKRSLSAEQVPELRSLLEECLPSRKK
jgi:hypothetical protein